MMRQRIERRLGGRNHLDVEALEQRARTKRWKSKTFVDVIEQAIGGFGRQTLLNAEDLVERVIEPEARGRASEQVIVGREGSPDLARILFAAAAIAARNAEILEPYALAVEHPEDIVIRRDEQRRGVAEWLVVGVPPGVGVTGGAYERQVLDRR